MPPGATLRAASPLRNPADPRQRRENRAARPDRATTGHDKSSRILRHWTALATLMEWVESRRRVGPPRRLVRGPGSSMAFRGKRKWRLVKWAGTSLFLAMSLCWLVTSACDVTYHLVRPARIITISFDRGCIQINSTQLASSLRSTWEVRLHRIEFARLHWVPRSASAGPDWMMRIPFGLPLLLLAALLTVVWRHCRDRGGCVGCGYDLTGNVSGVCPECGTGMHERRGIE